MLISLEVHFLASVVVACGAEDHELDVLVETLELRAQVKRLGVFYRKLVETEGLPHLGEFFRQRLEKTQPYESTCRHPRHASSREIGPRAGGDHLGSAHSR